MRRHSDLGFPLLVAIFSLASFGLSSPGADELPAKEPVATLRQPDRVTPLAVSPDGKTLAIGTQNQLVMLWDLTSQKETMTLRGHESGLWSLAFSPDSKLLASASLDQTAKLWDATKGKELHTLKGHHINSVRFSPDGKLLLTVGADKTVRFWDVKTGKERAHFVATPVDKEYLTCLALSSDGKTIACGSEDTVRLWDARTRKPRQLLFKHNVDVNALAYSADGKFLASVGKTVRVWDTKTNKQLHSFPGMSQIPLKK